MSENMNTKRGVSITIRKEHIEKYNQIEKPSKYVGDLVRADLDAELVALHLTECDRKAFLKLPRKEMIITQLIVEYLNDNIMFIDQFKKSKNLLGIDTIATVTTTVNADTNEDINREEPLVEQNIKTQEKVVVEPIQEVEKEIIEETIEEKNQEVDIDINIDDNAVETEVATDCDIDELEQIYDESYDNSNESNSTEENEEVLLADKLQEKDTLSDESTKVFDLNMDIDSEEDYDL